MSPTPDRWQRIEALYHSALERDPAARAAFLDGACGHDDDLRREVESLLAEAATGQVLLNGPHTSLPAESAVTELKPGARLGPYQIEGLIGEGGMGKVYRARDTRLGRTVAIKTSAQRFTDRFEREAHAIAALNHANICTLHDVGPNYLVMELVEGPTLAERMKRRPIPLEEALAIARQIADALEAAHEKGIVHRDLKPANIKIRPDGTVKVLDFGLAQAAEDSEFASELPTMMSIPGMILGTPGYMSPEQARGEKVDRRTDIWAFGVVLYEMVAGRRLIDEPDWTSVPARVERLLRLCLERDRNRRLRNIGGVELLLDSDGATSLRSAIEKAPEKDPDGRYQSMRDPVVDLKRATRQTVAEPAPAPARRGKPGRSRWKWIAVGAAALAAVAGGSGWVLLRTKSAGSAPRPEYTQLTNFADSAVAPTLSPDGRMLAFIRGNDTFEGPGDVYVKLLPNGDPVPLTHDRDIEKEGPVAFSPDGSRVAYTHGASGGETWIAPVLGGEPTRFVAKSSALSWIDPTPGQRRVMFSALVGEGIHLGIFESTESRSDLRTVYMPAGPNGMAHRSFLSPDRRNVLVVEMDLDGWQPCRLVPFDGSSMGRRIGPQPAQCTDAAWSPDGKWMYMAANTGDGYHIWRQPFPDGTPERVTSGATEEQGLSFDPDGRSFVTSVGASQSTLWVHDARGDRQITSEGFAFLPSFSADGRTLYYLVRSRASRRFVSGELWAANLETGHATRLLPDYLTEHYNVSPDGKRVVFLSVDESGHSQVSLAPLDASSPPHRLASPEYADRALFDPHGGVLFAGGEKGTYYLYHVNDDGTGLRKLLPGPVSYLYSISPDGRAVAVWVGIDVYVDAYDGSSQTLVCKACGGSGADDRGVTPALLSWSSDQRFFYVHAPRKRQTYAIPLRPGQLLPSLPEKGLARLSDAANLPGAKAFPEPRAFGGADPSVYAYPRVTTHRNIYRIPVP